MALAAVGLLLTEIITHWGTFKKVAIDAWTAIKPYVEPVWQMITDIYNALKWIVGAAKSIARAFSFGGPTPPARLSDSGGTELSSRHGRVTRIRRRTRRSRRRGIPRPLTTISRRCRSQIDGRTVTETIVHTQQKRTALA